MMGDVTRDSTLLTKQVSVLGLTTYTNTTEGALSFDTNKAYSVPQMSLTRWDSADTVATSISYSSVL